MTVESHCMRCRRPNPEANEVGHLPADWEVLTDDRGEVTGIICPGCITGAEDREILEDMVELQDEISRRRAEGEDL
jgi:hypothetical protein